MQKISDFQSEHYSHRDEVVPIIRRLDDKKSQETKKAAEDTKGKIRDAFSRSEKLKASLRP